MIFISYRREDSNAEVTHLHKRLEQRYGRESVFVDYKDIPDGARWPDVLRERLAGSDVVLAVIGSRWGKSRFTSGEKENLLRLMDREDWVRQEICTAVRARKLVIVVLIDDAKLPATKWDCELDELQGLQHRRLRNEGDFDNDFAALCGWMESQRPGLAAAAARIEAERARPAAGPEVSRGRGVDAGVPVATVKGGGSGGSGARGSRGGLWAGFMVLLTAAVVFATLNRDRGVEVSASAPAYVHSCDPIAVTFTVVNRTGRARDGLYLEVPLAESVAVEKPEGAGVKDVSDGVSYLRAPLPRLASGERAVVEASLRANGPGQQGFKPVVKERSGRAWVAGLRTLINVDGPRLEVSTGARPGGAAWVGSETTIRVTNRGTTAAKDVVVRQRLLGEGVVFEPGGGVLRDGALEWKLGELGVGQEREFSAKHGVSADVAAGMEVEAVSSCFSTRLGETVVGAEGLGLTLLSASGEPGPGRGLWTWTFRVKNLGNEPIADGVVLGAYAGELRWSDESWQALSSGGLTGFLTAIPSLGPLKEAEFELTVSSAKGGSFEMTPGVRWNAGKSWVRGPEQRFELRPLPAFLTSINLPSEVVACDRFMFQVQLKHDGDVAIGPATVRTELPEGFTFSDGSRRCEVRAEKVEVGQPWTGPQLWVDVNVTKPGVYQAVCTYNVAGFSQDKVVEMRVKPNLVIETAVDPMWRVMRGEAFAAPKMIGIRNVGRTPVSVDVEVPRPNGYSIRPRMDYSHRSTMKEGAAHWHIETIGADRIEWLSFDLEGYQPVQEELKIIADPGCGPLINDSRKITFGVAGQPVVARAYGSPPDVSVGDEVRVVLEFFNTHGVLLRGMNVSAALGDSAVLSYVGCEEEPSAKLIEGAVRFDRLTTLNAWEPPTVRTLKFRAVGKGRAEIRLSVSGGPLQAAMIDTATVRVE